MHVPHVHVCVYVVMIQETLVNSVSQVSAHGCFNITHNFYPHGHLPEIKIPYICIKVAMVAP